MADYAISPEFLKSYRDWQNQRWATTGIPPRPEDFQAVMEANLAQQAQNRYRDIQIQQSQQALDIQKQSQRDAARAATISGVTGLGTTALLTYGVGKQLGWWGAATPAAGAAPSAGIMTGAGVTEGEMVASTAAETGAGAGATSGLSYFPPVAAAVAYTYGPDMLRKAGMNEYWSKGLVRGGISALGAKADKESKLLGWVVDPVGHLADSISKATDTIICTELNRQGLITERMRRYGMMFGRQVGEEVYQGYLIAATPVVERMRRSRMFSRLVAFFAIPALKEIAHRINPRNRGNLLGAVVLHFGIPYCLRMLDRQADLCREVA